MEILIPVQSYGVARDLIPTAGQMTFSEVKGRDAVVITFTDQKVCVQVAKADLARALRVLVQPDPGDPRAMIERFARRMGLDPGHVENVINDVVYPHAERIFRERHAATDAVSSKVDEGKDDGK